MIIFAACALRFNHFDVAKSNLFKLSNSESEGARIIGICLNDFDAWLTLTFEYCFPRPQDEAVTHSWVSDDLT